MTELPNTATWQRARRPEQKQERRKTILRAASELLDAEGLQGTGLNAIARIAGISKPNIYRYFESREAILLQLLLEDHAAWVDDLAARFAAIPGPLEGVAAAEPLAAAFTASLVDRRRYCQLFRDLAAVLEQNVSTETVIAFKTELHTHNLRLTGALHVRMPSLSPEQSYATLAHLLMAATGIWPNCHPAPAVQAALELPEFAGMRFDFARELQQHAETYLRGLL
jgi:AcrR family transcriptional regulator